jgi:hypothetical protein
VIGFLSRITDLHGRDGSAASGPCRPFAWSAEPSPRP